MCESLTALGSTALSAIILVQQAQEFSMSTKGKKSQAVGEEQCGFVKLLEQLWDLVEIPTHSFWQTKAPKLSSLFVWKPASSMLDRD